jgi:hypothetical protein
MELGLSLKDQSDCLIIARSLRLSFAWRLTFPKTYWKLNSCGALDLKQFSLNQPPASVPRRSSRKFFVFTMLGYKG